MQIKWCFTGWHAVSNPSGKAAERDTSVNVFISESCLLKRFVSTSALWLYCPSWCATGLTRVTFAGFVSGMLSSWLQTGHSRFSCVFPSLLFCTQIFQGTEIRTERKKKRVLMHKALSKNVRFDNWILSKLAAIFLVQLDMSWMLLSRGLLSWYFSFSLSLFVVLCSALLYWSVILRMSDCRRSQRNRAPSNVVNMLAHAGFFYYWGGIKRNEKAYSAAKNIYYW